MLCINHRYLSGLRFLLFSHSDLAIGATWSMRDLQGWTCVAFRGQGSSVGILISDKARLGEWESHRGEEGSFVALPVIQLWLYYTREKPAAIAPFRGCLHGKMVWCSVCWIVSHHCVGLGNRTSTCMIRGEWACLYGWAVYWCIDCNFITFALLMSIARESFYHILSFYHLFSYG